MFMYKIIYYLLFKHTKFHANVQYFFIHQYDTILDTAIHHKYRDIQHKDTTIGTYTLIKRVCMNVVFLLPVV